MQEDVVFSAPLKAQSSRRLIVLLRPEKSTKQANETSLTDLDSMKLEVYPSLCVLSFLYQCFSILIWKLLVG